MKRPPPICETEWRAELERVGEPANPVRPEWDSIGAAKAMTVLVQEHQTASGLTQFTYERRAGVGRVLNQCKARGTSMTVGSVARIANAYDIPLAHFLWPMEPDPQRRAVLKALGEAPVDGGVEEDKGQQWAVV